MQDDNNGWRKFDKLHLDRNKLSKTVQAASGVTTRHAHRYLLSRFESVRHARNQILGWLLVMTLLIAAVVVQLVLFTPNYMKAAPTDGGTYAEATRGPIDTLNPLFAASPAESSTSKLLFSSLYTIDTSGSLATDLATGIKTSKDGKTYTVSLRDNAHWHDGTRLTAEDVVFTLRLIKNPQTRSALRINWRDVEVKATKDNAVEFTIPAVYAAFPYALTFPVLPKHLLENIAPSAVRENAFSRTPIGSGPFKFQLLQAADAVHNHKVAHFVANDNYYGGRPKLNRFEVHAYESDQAIARALRIEEVSGGVLASLGDALDIDNSKYRIITKPINSGVYLMFNTNHEVLKDLKVRQALRYATDTTEIRKTFGPEFAALDTPFVNGQLTGEDVPGAPKPDLKKAGELLDSAGWTLDGETRKRDGQLLKFNITATKDSQTAKTVDIIKQQWARVGVGVEAKIVDTSQPNANFWQDTLQPRNYDILLHELLIGADPDVYAYWHSSQIGANGYNFANYTNRTSDAALVSARSRLEPDLRNAKYKSFAKQWLDDAPAIGLYQQVMVYAENPGATTIDEHQKVTAVSDRFSNVLYWSSGKELIYKTP